MSRISKYLLMTLVLPVWVNAATNAMPRFFAPCTVANDILCIKVRDGKVHYGRQTPYTASSNDLQAVWKRYGSRFIQRQGTDVGALVGTNGAALMNFDTVSPRWLSPSNLDAPEYYTLRSPSHNAFKSPQSPIAVYRKTRPIDLARTGRWRFDAAVEHTLFLKFAHPLQGARTYELDVEDNLIAPLNFRHDPFTTVSQALHVNQIGFHPNDAVKIAFLSTWMAPGAPVFWGRSVAFRIIDNEDERTVFLGASQLRLAADAHTNGDPAPNHAMCDVHALDFSSFTSPGSYRIFIEGVGCSPTITIASNVWQNAFTTSAQGLYNQRSGVALTSDWTASPRPRSFHPEDGLRVFHSECSLMDSGNGLNAAGTDHTQFGNINAARTDTHVSNAWGGYFNGGDWGRRIQHLDAARLLLELFEVNPDFFKTHALRIPESTNDLPDVIDEALWGIDLFRRMQTADGGIRGGIESANHPRFGECSWQESLPVMAYAPGAWASYVYAGVAARAARCLMILNHASASTYLDSALQAMAFAEASFQRRLRDKKSTIPHAAHDARNLAAAELYRITGDARWNTLFLASTAFTDAKAPTAKWQAYDQRDAAYVYGQITWHKASADVARNARKAILRDAERSVGLTRTTAFGWGQDHTQSRQALGALSTPQVIAIIRAHAISGRKRYADAVLMACQTGAGANPLNLCYTTGIGHSTPRNPLVINTRMQSQAPPAGITVFGPMALPPDGTATVNALRRFVYPDIRQWPVVECYFDVYMVPAMCEFTVHQTIASNVYAWGYLAATER